MSRDALIRDFLAQHGYADAHAAPLAQDASFRRYLRLTGGPRSAVLMDAPPPEDVRPFLRIGADLAAIGVSVPAIFAADPATGLLLEEDLGDELLSHIVTPPPLAGGGWGEGAARGFAHPAVAGEGPPSRSSQATKRQEVNGRHWAGHDGEGAPAAPQFDAAIDTLVAIQRAPPPPELPLWDAPTMASTTLAVLFDWWWPAMFASPAPDAARRDFAAALEATLAPVAAGPVCFVHRDFFAENLLWLPERPSIRRIGVIDFQGAALGHPAYDLVSLLQDARRDIPAELADRAIARYLAARPELDAAASHAASAACAAQRHLRVACQWVRLARRDHRPGYLIHGPRTWRLLQRAVQHPAAAPLAAVLDRWIPPDRRRNPP